MTIKLHHLKPAPGERTAKTRVGRGEGSKGKTAGRGTKGTKARKNGSGLQAEVHLDIAAEAEQSGVVRTGSIRVDQSADRRTHAVGTDQDVGVRRCCRRRIPL